MKACKNKWYNEGFANAENFVDLIFREARKLRFKERWLAALQAIGVPEDSTLRNPDQIPFPDPFPAVQNLPSTVDEEETPSIRELVQAIDSYMELVNLEVTNNLRAGGQPDENVQLHSTSSTQPLRM